MNCFDNNSSSAPSTCSPPSSEISEVDSTPLNSLTHTHTDSQSLSSKLERTFNSIQVELLNGWMNECAWMRIWVGLAIHFTLNEYLAKMMTNAMRPAISAVLKQKQKITKQKPRQTVQPSFVNICQTDLFQLSESRSRLFKWATDWYFCATAKSLNGNCVMNYEREKQKLSMTVMMVIGNRGGGGVDDCVWSERDRNKREKRKKNSTARCFQSNRLSRIWLPSVVLLFHSLFLLLLPSPLLRPVLPLSLAAVIHSIIRSILISFLLLWKFLQKFLNVS